MQARKGRSGCGGKSTTKLLVGAVTVFVSGFLLGRMNKAMQNTAPLFLRSVVEDPVKQKCEMNYWESVSKREGTMNNDW